MNAEKGQSLGFQPTDVVVGFRVNKYRHKRKSLFSKERTTKGKLFIKCAEMLDDKTQPAKNLDRFEDVPIEEDASAQKEDGNQEGSVVEFWVR
ncbi:hypothetical protein J3458_001583 [Metarhizium acridum]|uniref:uncharacterized protein n=1 Tax=Metarhizium acridum TaxID=92637 RepID=UPI001C6AD35D|nr:hypothetical protein J3458_001583 [Metarhizium acridum]